MTDNNKFKNKIIMNKVWTDPQKLAALLHTFFLLLL